MVSDNNNSIDSLRFPRVRPPLDISRGTCFGRRDGVASFVRALRRLGISRGSVGVTGRAKAEGDDDADVGSGEVESDAGGDGRGFGGDGLEPICLGMRFLAVLGCEAVSMDLSFMGGAAL